MKIALVNVTKPAPGTIDIVTEYAYRLYEEYTKGKSNSVDLVYAVEQTKSNNVSGLVYTQTAFRDKVAALADKGYDVVHVVNQEIGFAARVLKRANPGLRVVTTVHDTLRLTGDHHKGVLQNIYSSMVKDNIEDSLEYSDCLIFRTQSTMDEINRLYPKRNEQKIVPFGIKGEFIRKPVRKAKGKAFTIGYIGSLAGYRNVMAMLETAKHLGSKAYRFVVYGMGTEYSSLLDFKTENKLSNVDLAGVVPDRELVQAYDSFDAFFYPGMEEDFANQIREAQSRGVPVVIFKDSKLSEEIRSYCIEAYNEKHASNIIETLKSKGFDPKQKKAAMEYARSFTWQKAAAETLALYRKPHR